MKWILCLFLPSLWAKQENEPFLWLEKIKEGEALSWVNKQNKRTLDLLAASKSFKKLQTLSLQFSEANDKIPHITFRYPHVYNLWRDSKHIKGIWRRTSIKSYKSKWPKWEILIDVDALAKEEKKNWVFKRVHCLPTEFKHCLVSLSLGGKDAEVIREFDIDKKKFVKKGFHLPENKSETQWVDQDHILVGTDFGKGSFTNSGYPRIIKLWKRGTALEDSKKVFVGKKSDISVSSFKLRHSNNQITIIARYMDFFNKNYWLYENKKNPKNTHSKNR